MSAEREKVIKYLKEIFHNKNVLQYSNTKYPGKGSNWLKSPQQSVGQQSTYNTITVYPVRICFLFTAVYSTGPISALLLHFHDSKQEIEHLFFCLLVCIL